MVVTDRKGGNIQPQLDLQEHALAAQAKRALMVGALNTGSGFASPSIFDYTNSDPMAVVLVDTAGTPYVASGGGGGAATTVTAFIAATVTLGVYWTEALPVSVTSAVVSGTVTAHAVLDEPIEVNWTSAQDVNVSGTVTAHAVIPDTVSISGTVTATAILDEPIQVNWSPAQDVNVAGTVTAHAVIPDTLSVSGNVTAHSVITDTVTVSGNVGVSGNVTAHAVIPDTVNVSVTNSSISATVTAGDTPLETKRVGTEIRTRTIYVGTTSEQLPSLGQSDSGIAIKWKSTNSGSVFIGPGTSVNGTIDDVNSGIELEPGDAATFPTDLSTDLYAIAPTATGVLTMFSVLP